jgi:ABC-type uncharacterized transport system fused permease/ATPase subunit
VCVDTDDISEAWMVIENAITQTAGTVLNRTERITYKNWFNAECEQATFDKNKAYKRMQQSILRKQRNIELPDWRKKEYIKKRRKYSVNVILRNWNILEVVM